MTSIPNLTSSIIQPQNIVINQVPLSHAIMTNVNTNGLPLATALTHQTTNMDQGDIKTGIVMETIPIAGTSIVGVQNAAPATKTIQNISSGDSLQVSYLLTLLILLLMQKFCRF